MTKDEARKALLNYCDKEIDNSGFWIFGKKKLDFESTKLMKQWEKTANIKLPEKLQFQGCVIDKNGIHIGKITHDWSDIIVTGIKTEIRPNYLVETGQDIRIPYLLVYLKNGTILDLPLGDIGEYYGLIGHYIEQYKNIISEK